MTYLWTTESVKITSSDEKDTEKEKNLEEYRVEKTERTDIHLKFFLAFWFQPDTSWLK